MPFIDKTKIKITEDKLKTLIPTLRQKKRFIRFQIKAEKKLTFEEFEKGFQKLLIEYLGILNFGKAGVWILKDKFDFEKQEFILRINNKFEKEICGITSLLEEINQIKINLISIKISGTIKGVLEEPRKNKKIKEK